MRALWTIISVVALVNLLAVVGFAGWLGASGRISAARIERVRAVFAPTLAEEERAEGEAARKAEADAAAAVEQGREGTMPMPVAERASTLEELEAIAVMRAKRAEGQTDRMMDVLALSWEELKRERAKFEDERRAFEAMRRRVAETEGDDQFRKTVAMYDAVGAESAKAMLGELISRDGGAGGANMDRAVAYLNAMKARTAAQVVRLFQEEDAALAADLLDRLREYGTLTRAPGAPTPDADAAEPANPPVAPAHSGVSPGVGEAAVE